MIKQYLQQFDLDVRKSGDARFMDQKCTPDVVCIIADCVINFVGNDQNKSFTVADIWNSQYFIKNVKSIFNKPLATNPSTNSEYDKFIQQPLRLLAYANILNIKKNGITNNYAVANYEILEYVSIKDRNAYLFLCDYLEKVLTDSGIFKYFEEYKTAYEKGTLDSDTFDKLKIRFQKFIIGNTKINGVVEVNRIYPKILNIYATQNNLPGTIKGFLSKNEFYYTDLMYNRKNWRDLDKNKNVSRQESEAEYDTLISENENPYNDYLVQKAMTIIRKLYTESEIKDQWANGEATQIHHIFPKHKFPQLAHYLENLIKLTATQHYTKAHPSNKTKDINIDYQLVCLLAKSTSIEKSIKKNEIYYRKESFIYCINVGLNQNLDFNLNLSQIKVKLARLYNY
jgi:hypothetical protein